MSLMKMMVATIVVVAIGSSVSGDGTNLEDIKKEVCALEKRFLPTKGISKIDVDVVYGGSIMYPKPAKMEESKITTHKYSLPTCKEIGAPLLLEIDYDGETVLRARISYTFQQDPQRDQEGKLSAEGMQMAMYQESTMLKCLKELAQQLKNELDKAPWNQSGT